MDHLPSNLLNCLTVLQWLLLLFPGNQVPTNKHTITSSRWPIIWRSYPVSVQITGYQGCHYFKIKYFFPREPFIDLSICFMMSRCLGMKQTTERILVWKFCNLRQCHMGHYPLTFKPLTFKEVGNRVVHVLGQARARLSQPKIWKWSTWFWMAKRQQTPFHICQFSMCCICQDRGYRK